MVEILDNLTPAEIQRILIVGSKLNNFQSNGENGIKSIIKDLGMVQLDPLNPAGRNHDIFFFSRVKDYMIGQFEELSYPEKLIFEANNPNLMAISIEYFPLLSIKFKEDLLSPYYQTRLDKFQQAHPHLLEELLEHLKANGPTKGSNLDRLGKAHPEVASWKTNRLSGTGLELLWLLGKTVIVKRDKQFRKYYDLTENYVPNNYKKTLTLTGNEFHYQLFKLKQLSYHVIPMGKITVIKNGKFKFGKSKDFQASWFEKPYFDDSLLIYLSKELPGYLIPKQWEQYLKNEYDDEMRALAPLDPIIWDRGLAKNIFDFEYVWEVYKKPEQRKWGYYVYPLLYQGKLIGRIEAVYSKKHNTLKFFNFRLEQKKKLDIDTKKAFYRLFDRWTAMLGLETYEKDASIS